LVFPDSVGGLRDPANTRRDLRNARGTAGFEWVTSHVFRKTAATVLDEAGLTARVVADQLGHARPSMTQDVYLGRKQVSPEAAAAIEGMLDFESPNIRGISDVTDLGEGGDDPPDLGGCAPPGTRTPNPLIKSQLLCQLS
jgi:Phage integrase family